MKLLPVTAFWLCITALLPHAYGQSAADRATARELAHEGQTAYEAGDYALAEDRFSRADALVHAPTLVLALARSQVKLGKLVQAYESYQAIIREGVPANSPPVFQEAYESAQREADALRPRLAWVTLVVTGAESPTVLLDADTPVPAAALNVKRAVNPGTHKVTVSADGFRESATEFSVKEGEVLSVTLALERASVAAADGGPTATSTVGFSSNPEADSGHAGSSQQTFGYALLGIGAAGIITGGVTGILAYGKHAELEDNCLNGSCPPGERDTLDSYRLYGNLSTVSFIIGGVGAAAGITLLLTAPASSDAGGGSSPHVALTYGIGHLSLKTRF